MGIANTCALQGFGGEDNVIARVMRARVRREADTSVLEGWVEAPSAALERAISLNRTTNLIVLRRINDPGVLAYLHVVLAFFRYISTTPALLELVEQAMPWEALVSFLNMLASTAQQSRHDDSAFPRSEKGDPLPEDWALRGFVWAEIFPADWFPTDRSKIDDSDRLAEHEGIQDERGERILWLAARMAESANGWLVYNSGNRRFAVREGYAHDGWE